ncbi:MAG: signal peptidase II [Cyanobacteriota bacterium]|nr:signal peptidase II [Cyanobacteriota bacterium]
MTTKTRRDARRTTLLLAALVVLLDQLSKQWALGALPAGVLRPWLPGLLGFQLVYNRGAAFSLLTGAPMFLALVSAAVVIGLGWWVLRQPQLRPTQVLALGLLLGGAAGNGLDRWRSGAVVDFLALVPIDFPVFNLADVAINLAVVSFAIDLLGNRGSHEP